MGYSLSLKEIQDVCPDFNGQKLNIEISVLVKAIKNVMGEAADSFLLKSKSDFANIINNTSVHTKELRDIFEEIADAKNISIDSNRLNLVYKTRNACKELFYAVFDFDDDGGKSNQQTLEAKQETTNETQKLIAKAVSPEDDGDSSLPELQKSTLTFSQAYAVMESCRFNILNGVKLRAISMTDTMPIEVQQGFKIHIPGEADVFRGCMLLFDGSTREVAAIGSIAPNGKDECLVFEADNINFDIVKKKSSFRMALFTNAVGKKLGLELTADDIRNMQIEMWEVKQDVNIKCDDLESTDNTLCIDFGTSNTAVGSYGLKNPQGTVAELVEFVDETAGAGNIVKRYTFPTLVYVYDCDNNSVEYRFGYEAKNLLVRENYTPKGSFFSEIKRWMTDLEGEEEIHGCLSNNKVTVQHGDIIKAYLTHVITLAERYFKRKFKYLHFSAPVKLHDSFIAAVNKMFNGKYMINNNCLDEAVSVIYSHLSNVSSDSKHKSGNIFVFDCGGGTTDFAKCSYELHEDEQLGNELAITVGFVNGDSDFGGNNITYRILQILKIKLAAKWLGAESFDSDIQKLIPNSREDIMTKIDGDLTEKEVIYHNFEAAYAKAGEIIPTDYGNEEDYEEDIVCKKRNFYFLWNMAERMKVEFYNTTSRVNIRFNEAQDRKLCIGDDACDYLYVRNSIDDDLQQSIKPAENIEVTIKEIEQVILTDIYALLKKVFPDYEVSRYDDTSFKLSGQSCHIEMFKDLFKEFIPGRYIRKRTEADKLSEQFNKECDSDKLKLPCVKGSIAYIQKKRSGELHVKMNSATANMIYDVINTDLNKEMLSHDENKPCFVMTTRWGSSEARFTVRDANNNTEKYNCLYEYNGKPMGKPEKVVEIMSRVERAAESAWFAKHRDHIAEECVNAKCVDEKSTNIIFMVPAKHGYGYVIFFLLKTANEEYYFQNETYKPYENEALKCFFDGKH